MFKPVDTPPAAGSSGPLGLAPRASESPADPTGPGSEDSPDSFRQTLRETREAHDKDEDKTGAVGWFALLQPDHSPPGGGRSLPVQPGRAGKGLPQGGSVTQVGVPLDSPQMGPVQLGVGAATGSTDPGDGLIGKLAGGLASLPASADQALSVEPQAGGGGHPLSALLSHPLPPPGQARVVPLAPPIDLPVGTAGWDKAMGERVRWLVSQHLQRAEVKLTPPHLGPLEIRIAVHQDQASVSFHAANASTREALEAAVPRLREMLGELNLNLSNVDVGHREGSAQGQQQGFNPASAGGPETTDATGSKPGPVTLSTARVADGGLLDHYV